MTTLAEELVLQPLDPVPDDVNQWPDFSLTEVKIFHQGKGRYAELLEASEQTPLCVLGELVPLEDEQTELALIEDCDYVRIKIDNVTNYSFGQDDNGKPVVWAAGKAGWYEITPSDRYLNYYNDTIEAIDLFYFMVDQHQKLPRKRQRLGFMIDPFLTAYQKHTDYRIDDDDEAMETIHKHHKFLLKQMIEEREGIDWSQTHLWKHLAEIYYDEVDTLKMRQPQHESTGTTSEEEGEGETEEINSEGVSEDSEASRESEESEESEESAESVASEEADEIESDAESEAVESEEEKEAIDWTQPIWNLLNILRKSANFSIRHCGIDQLATELQKHIDFNGDHEEAIAAIEHSAESLLRLMNEAKLRKKFNWSTRAIYNELEATLADEIAENDTIQTPAQKSDKRHRQKSVLRPSGAGKARKRTRQLQGSDDEDDDGETMSSTHSRQHPNGPPSSPPTVPGRFPTQHGREGTIDTYASLEDSPSRQLNGHIDSLPELPPAPEAQEMLELVAKEAKMVGRQHQTANLEAFLSGQWFL